MSVPDPLVQCAESQGALVNSSCTCMCIKAIDLLHVANEFVGANGSRLRSFGIILFPSL